MGWGDDIMVSGRARVMQQMDPRKVRVICPHRAQQWSQVWDGNPRIAKPEEAGDFQELYARSPKTNMRPYHTAKTQERWTYDLNFRPEVGELYFTDAERELGARYAGRIIVEPQLKPGASPNKQWGLVRWNKLAGLVHRAGLRVTQLGPSNTPILDGAELVVTENFRSAAAVLKNARAAVLPEGGTHHAAAALGVKAVVIFGGFTPVELTGYPMHRNLGVSADEACGMRQPCRHCADAMAAITPERVFEELKEMLI